MIDPDNGHAEPRAVSILVIAVIQSFDRYVKGDLTPEMRAAAIALLTEYLHNYQPLPANMLALHAICDAAHASLTNAELLHILDMFFLRADGGFRARATQPIPTEGTDGRL